MPCPAVTTSRGFLSETLAHLDCQAQTLGSFGFQSLAAPGSLGAAILLALLTLFIAIFGLRLLLGVPTGSRDLVGAGLKIGVVLTLALSWPAYRILAYDTVLLGPAEIAASLGSDNLPDLRSGFADRLQGIDDALVRLSALGTGRQTGSLERPGEAPDSFTGVALQDEAGFAWGRVIYLGATIGSLAMLRVAGGLLLALAPLFAGLMLFDLARGLFAGWLRGLALVALGSLGMALILAVQVALMEPWLADILTRRQLGYATPAAPTELVALTLGFALAGLALLALLARVAFQNAWPVPALANGGDSSGKVHLAERMLAPGTGPIHIASARAASIGHAVAARIQRENWAEARRLPRIADMAGHSAPERSVGGRGAVHTQALGSSYRRSRQRASAAGALRNRQG